MFSKSSVLAGLLVLGSVEPIFPSGAEYSCRCGVKFDGLQAISNGTFDQKFNIIASHMGLARAFMEAI